MKSNYVTETSAGDVAQVSSEWTYHDVWSTIKVRWSIGRMDYAVMPGLYAVGHPDKDSDVYVSCNFKLSFDHLRRALHGMDAWILVLDTKGINVWCAAGKGTFGTKELAYRIETHRLEDIVSHRKVIVPQLGATGVSAYQIKEETGFKVVYGPVEAGDIPAFVANGYRATPKMRRIAFNLWDRMKLIPVELFYAKYYLMLVPAVFFILSGFYAYGYSVDSSWSHGGRAVVNLYAAYLSGCVLTPMLLPIVPFKMFSLKGMAVGWLVAVLLLYFDFLGANIFEIISWFLLIGGVSSFMAMNFTGASTFTSLSGVQKEMKLWLPIQICGVALGFTGWMITRFI